MVFADLWVDVVARGAILAVAAMAWVALLVRVSGLRSLSQMTGFALVMTFAVGSLVAGAAQADSWAAFVQPLVAMVGLFAAQWMVATLRRASPSFRRAIQNEPTLLMRNGTILQGALRRTRVAESDLLTQLREAGVTDLDEVQAVVLESTGSISVMRGGSLGDELLDGVARAPNS